MPYDVQEFERKYKEIERVVLNELGDYSQNLLSHKQLLILKRQLESEIDLDYKTRKRKNDKISQIKSMQLIDNFSSKFILAKDKDNQPMNAQK